MKLSTSLNQSLLLALAGYNGGSVSFGTSGHCWLGLSTTVPTDAGGNFTEPPASKGYVRTNIHDFMGTTYKSASLEESSATVHYRRIGSTGQITFHEALLPDEPEALSGADWGTVLYWGIFTAKTGGSLIAWGKLAGDGVSIRTHDVFLFRDGEFEIVTEETEDTQDPQSEGE